MFSSRQVGGKDIWFVIHQPFMMFTALASFLGLIAILIYTGWKWQDPVETPVNYAHSIIGIIVISLAIIQVLKCFFRY